MTDTITTGITGHKAATHHHYAHSAFDEQHVLHELRHYLPTQTPLRDFIHHNSLHAFQQKKFYEAIFTASKIFGYQVTLQLEEFRELYRNGRIRADILDRILSMHSNPEQWKQRMISGDYDTANEPRIGELRHQWKQHAGIDLDYHVQPVLFRILSAYLDQGISTWKFPLHPDGFLASLREMETQSFSSFFRTSRAKKLLADPSTDIPVLMKLVVGDESMFARYIFDQQFAHRGWSGMVATIESRPDCLLDQRKISLKDYIIFTLLLEIDALDFTSGKNWKPLSTYVTLPPEPLFAPVFLNELQEVLRLWQDAFEWSYYDEVLKGIALNRQRSHEVKGTKSFQAIFCIDERECSLRRHIESTDLQCETFATPGFFSVEFYFRQQGAKFNDKLCPAPVTPAYLIKESGGQEHHAQEPLYSKHAHSLILGTIMTFGLGTWAAIRTFLNLTRPKMSPAISDATSHMGKDSILTVENTDPNHREDGLQVGFTITEMTNRVESLLRSIGMIKEFAPVIYVIGHGSSSANNPHHGAHDCGACSGRPGSVNARVFSIMANHPKVRVMLKERGIEIPGSTRFIGGMHDTAADQVEFYDERLLDHAHKEAHAKNKNTFESALDLNAKERSRRFFSINTRQSLRNVREAIRKRSVSLFEPRPELGHGTNSLCIVGERKLTKKLFLDRRAFMNSYDYKTDPEGKLLLGIMKPIGPVCGGINLEYYFSRIDIQKLGAGTKLPHNVSGLIGVTNSSDGDLRPGLPLQMIEPHDPVRLLVIVEHFPEVVLKTIQSAPELYEWFINDWVHLVAMNPETGSFHYFREGNFIPYEPLTKEIKKISSFTDFVESAPEMESGAIGHATKENLPVYLID